MEANLVEWRNDLSIGENHIENGKETRRRKKTTVKMENGENCGEYGEGENCERDKIVEKKRIVEKEKIMEKWNFVLKQGQFWNI